jgi:tRNA G18 (ribose-2'-O)-methylase SpoU
MERCRPIGIPMSGGFDSLNVSVASGIALHHFTRQA